MTTLSKQAVWDEKELGTIIEIFDDKRSPLASIKRANKQGKYPYYGASGIIDYLDEYLIDGEYLLIAEDGENLKSRNTPIAFWAKGKFWVNNHAHIVLGRKGIANTNFIKAWFSQADISGYITGSAQPKLSQANLKKIKILLPDLNMQNQITSVISAYDSLIENNEKRIKILEEMAQRLYKNKITVKSNDKKKFLKEIIFEHIGGGWGSDTQSEINNIPAHVLRGTDIIRAKMGNTQDIPFRYHKQSNFISRKLGPGDIVFEVSGGSPNQPLGRTVLITEEFLKAFKGSLICASFCKRIKVDKTILFPEILYLSFLDAQNNGEINSYEIRSTGISNFKWTDYINNVDRYIPSQDIQNTFRNLVKPLFSEIAILGRINSKLKETRDLLISQFVTGRRRLKNG